MPTIIENGKIKKVSVEEYNNNLKKQKEEVGVGADGKLKHSSVDNLGKIWINGQEFTGMAYQGILTVNTKTYVEEPTRANDGSIPNINDHDTFVVPRCKVNFKYFNIEDYRRLCRVTLTNEFYVEYYDKDFDCFVKHKMYCEPQEMIKLYNVGTDVFGVLDYEISFIGTLNNLEEFTVNYDVGSLTRKTINDYDANILYTKDTVVRVLENEETKYYKYKNETSASGNPVTDTEYWEQVYDNLANVEKVLWGNSVHILSPSDITNFYIIPVGQTFKGWNSLSTGDGFNILPNSSWSVFENITIYPIIGE